MRKGRTSFSSGKQESAPSTDVASTNASSSIRSRLLEGGNSDVTPVGSCHHGKPTLPEGSSETSRSGSGWNDLIQNEDWASLQRYLEQLASPPIPQLPQERHSNSSSSTPNFQSRKSPKSTRDSNGSKRKSSFRPSSSLNWIRRSVASMGTSMGNMSGRTERARLIESHNHEAAIEEQEDEDHSSVQPSHLDKDSLLLCNAAGRTPLQLALNEPKAPDYMVLHLLRAQPKAVSIADNKGRLPLHFAVVRKRRMETVAELVELFADAMYITDQKGKTPLSYAIEVGKRKTDLLDAPRKFWASPPSRERNCVEANWQNTQHRQWEMARWLLQTSACLHDCQNHARQHYQFSATSFPLVAVDHQHPFLIKNGARSQEHVLIEAMLHAAPPTVVALLVEACVPLLTETLQVDGHERRQYQDAIVSMGCTAFYLAIFRQYPLEIFKRLGSLLESRSEVKEVRDETGLGLVSAHYVTSCFEKSKLLEYVAEEDFMVTMEQCIVEGQLPEDNIPFLEWWDKLKYLIFFCADKDSNETSDDYLLHAALENTDTPPNVVRLLLALYPGSARQPDAQSAHPLHLFAKHRDYIPRNYESPYMHGLNVMDMLLSLDESAVFHNFQKRLPLHHAIAAGRTWSTIHPIISSYRSSLRMQDPITNLYPCQLAAAYREDDMDEENTRLLQLARNQYSAIVWQGLSQPQQIIAVDRIRHLESLKRLDTIFELFRRYPQCVETATDATLKQNRKKKNEVEVEEEKIVSPADVNQGNAAHSKKGRDDSAGPEMITFHYLSWCYSKVGGAWRVSPENMQILQTSIRVAAEHRVLSQKSADFVNWWGMLKMYFFHCYNSMTIEDKLIIPKGDNYLLHLAVSIPTTPPDLIELILGLYPESASSPLPHTTMFPLHLACKATVYTPQYFEVVERPTTLELVLEEFPEATYARSSSGQTPLHIAIESGKTINELRPLLEHGPTLVSSRDPVSGLYPYQLMALSKHLSSDMRLRFRTLAANNHSGDWRNFTGQRKMKEIRTVEKEYQMTVLDSIFELLRLAPSVISSSEIPVPDEGKPGSRTLLRSMLTRSGNGSQSSLGLDSGNSSDPIFELPHKGRRRALKRLASSASRDSSVGASSAFSTIDMMSTISNVSSHLSFRRTSSISEGKPSKGGSMLGEEYSDDESEDSDIWSEDVSFHEEGKKNAGKTVEKEAEYEQTKTPSQDQMLQQDPPKPLRQQKAKSKWEAPAHFGAVATGTVDRKSIPKVIVESSDGADDVSFLDNINPGSMSGRRLFRRSLIGGSTSSAEEHDIWAEPNPNSGGVLPEDLKVPEPQVVSDHNPETRRRSTIPIPVASSDCKESEEDEQDESEADDIDDDSIQAGSKESQDASIQDEIVLSAEVTQDWITAPAKATKDEDPVVVFRLRKTLCQRASSPRLSKVRSQSLGSTLQSEKDMDFLSILNASLPEGKIDYLSTLGVSSGNPPLVSDSVPTGLDMRRKFGMACIQELGSDSEHSEFQPTCLGKGSQSRRATVAAMPSHKAKTPLSPQQDRDASLRLLLAPPNATACSPKTQTSRRRPSQINPKTVVASPAKVELCLNCEAREREVLMLPCSHLCICRVCAIEEDIKSCLICFGAVSDKKVQKASYDEGVVAQRHQLKL